MKSFLTVLVLTAGVVLGYVFVRGDDGPQRSGGAAANAPRGNVPAPRPQRPQAGRNRTETSNQVRLENEESGNTTRVDPEVLAQIKADRERSKLTWDHAVSEDSYVRVEDAWTFDWERVDFDADVLATIAVPGAEPVVITQDEFRAFACATFGGVIFESAVAEEVAKAWAIRNETSYGFSDEIWKLYLETFARESGFDVSEVPGYLSRSYELPASGAELIRRRTIECLLGLFPAVDVVDQLHPIVLESLPDKEDRAWVAQIVNTLEEPVRDPRGSMEDGTPHIDRIYTNVQALYPYGQKIFAKLNFVHGWTFMDGPVREGAVGGVYVGEADPGQVTPPWLLGDEVVWIETEDIWKHLEPWMNPYRQLDILRELIWNRVLRQHLAGRGQLASHEDAWISYASDYLARENTLFHLKFVSTSFYGFPTIAQYRFMTAVRHSFLESRDGDWGSEEARRAFFQDNRFVCEGWSPLIEVVYFSPYDFDAEGGVATDWEKARQRAEAWRERAVSEPDFDFVQERLQHSTALARKIGEHFGDAAAEDYMERLGSGQFSDSMNATQLLLKEQRHDQYLNAVSVLRNAITRLAPEEISPVWGTRLGYVILRISGAVRSGLEAEYEDRITQTDWEYETSHFLVWLNGVLSEAEML